MIVRFPNLKRLAYLELIRKIFLMVFWGGEVASKNHKRKYLDRYFVLIISFITGLAGCNLSPTITLSPLPTPVVVIQQIPSETPLPTPSLTPTNTLTLTPLPTRTPFPPVSIESLGISSRYLGNSRVLSIYLPPSYQSQPERHYKVLYSNDGQDLPIMFLEQDLNSFYASGLMQQVIVVGIPANDNRIYEYGTGSIKNTDGWGANAQAYLNFVLKEVIPLVNSKYRTLTGPENTAYVGWSLGGLTSFYAAWTHPEVFGTVGAISGSFWWGTNINNLPDLLASRVAQKLVRESTTHPKLRFWFSAGTNEIASNDRDKNGVIDMVQDTTDLIQELTKKGYQSGVDYAYEQVEGGTHDQASFGRVLPDFLRWAFPPS